MINELEEIMDEEFQKVLVANVGDVYLITKKMFFYYDNISDERDGVYLSKKGRWFKYNHDSVRLKEIKLSTPNNWKELAQKNYFLMKKIN